MPQIDPSVPQPVVQSRSASRRFQPGEGPSRGLLRDCTTSPINRFAALIISLHLKWSLSVNMPTTSTNTCTRAGVAVTIQGRRAAQSCFDPQLGPDSIGGHGVSHSSHSRQQSHCVSHTVVTLAVTVQPDQWTINRESLFVPLV